MVLEEDGSLSKTTKLLLLDSLLQEVCIESGSDGSLALSSLGLSVCLVSHNLLYSGLKKAHSKMKSSKAEKRLFLSASLNDVSQSVGEMAKEGKTMQNVYSNLYSQAVTHPSTNRSQPCLTSVIGRELVYSR